MEWVEWSKREGDSHGGKARGGGVNGGTFILQCTVAAPLATCSFATPNLSLNTTDPYRVCV